MEKALPTLSQYFSQFEDPLTTNDKIARHLAHSFEMQSHRIAMIAGVVLHQETALVLNVTSCAWIAPFRTLADADDKDLSYLLVKGEQTVILSAQEYHTLLAHPVPNSPPPLFSQPERS
jgi:hypothetical protein